MARTMRRTVADKTLTLAIEARGVRKVYTGGSAPVEALRGIDMAVKPGEFVAVTGSSGSGKSTLMHLLGGLDRPTEGEVYLGGRLLSRLSRGELAKVRAQHVG